jgi:hypothetical protein
MAKQSSIIKLEGTIDDITFVKTADGYMAKKVSRVSASTMANSLSFQRTRENQAEFGRACKANRVIRHAFNTLLTNAKGKRVIARLTKELMKAVKADIVNPRGLRTVTDGELGFLKGFEFNNSNNLKTTLTVPYTTSIDRVTGVMQVDVPSLVPTEAVKAPEGATHYRLVCGAAEINFDTEEYKTDTKESTYLPLIPTTAPALGLTATVPAASTHPLFMVVGIQFFQQVNGIFYVLKSGEHNALSLVEIDS